LIEFKDDVRMAGSSKLLPAMAQCIILTVLQGLL